VPRNCGANGKKLIEALVVIALGDDKARQNLFGERTAWPTLRDRMTAIEMLLERGFGRPLQVEEIDASAECERLPEIIINLPCSPAQMQGHRVVTGLVPMEETEDG
jgi:hypothetical protein